MSIVLALARVFHRTTAKKIFLKPQVCNFGAHETTSILFVFNGGCSLLERSDNFASRKAATSVRKQFSQEID